MSQARFEVTGALDGTGALQKGTVFIDRETGMVTVRPHRKHTTYTMPLSVVATMICAAELRSRVRDELLAKKAERAGR